LRSAIRQKARRVAGLYLGRGFKLLQEAAGFWSPLAHDAPFVPAMMR
jgi:hypothetical protein